MAHVQLMQERYPFDLIKKLESIGYTCDYTQDSYLPNEHGNRYLVTRNGKWFCSPSISLSVNWGTDCLENQEKFIQEAKKEISCTK